VEYRDAPRRCFVTATTRQWFGTREVGHVRFGARTEWALVMLGLVLLVGALLLADSVATIFRLFPLPVVGVILLFGGLELAASVNGETFSRPDRIVLLVTAGIAFLNMGAALIWRDCCSITRIYAGSSGSNKLAETARGQSSEIIVRRGLHWLQFESQC
jgi:Molybdate transporter of MFS superfamily